MSTSWNSWQKTTIPAHMKIVLWRVMRNNRTQTARAEILTRLRLVIEDWENLKRKRDYFASEYFLEFQPDLKDQKWLGISRDTFKSLRQELVDMPNEEVNLLPEDLQPWVRGLREQFEHSKSHNKDIQDHWNDLSVAALQLVECLKPSLIHLWDETIAEIAVENDDFDTLDVLADYHAKCLLPHMQAELPELRNLTRWDDLIVKDVTSELLDRLSLRAARRNFEGECEICKN